jgi:hypothetical protein
MSLRVCPVTMLTPSRHCQARLVQRARPILLGCLCAALASPVLALLVLQAQQQQHKCCRALRSFLPLLRRNRPASAAVVPAAVQRRSRSRNACRWLPPAAVAVHQAAMSLSS